MNPTEPKNSLTMQFGLILCMAVMAQRPLVGTSVRPFPTLTIRQRVAPTTITTTISTTATSKATDTMEYRAAYLWNDEQVKKETQNQVLVIAGACLAGLAVIMGTVLGVYYYRMEKPKNDNNTFIHIQRKRVKIPALEQVVVKGMPTARVKEYVVPSALPTAPLDQLDYALPSAPLDHLGYAPSSGRSSIRDSCSIAPESSISQAAPLPVIPHRKASQDTELVLLPKQVSNLKTPVSASRPFSFQNTPSDMIGTFVDFDPMSEVGVSVDVPVRSKIPVPREL